MTIIMNKTSIITTHHHHLWKRQRILFSVIIILAVLINGADDIAVVWNKMLRIEIVLIGCWFIDDGRVGRWARWKTSQ